MKKLFENWRSFLNEQDSTTPIKSPEGVVTGYEFKSGDEQQPKDDKYTQALQDIANNIKNIAAKQNFLDLAAGRQAVFQDNNPDSVRTGYKKISPGTQGLIKAAAMVYAIAEKVLKMLPKITNPNTKLIEPGAPWMGLSLETLRN